MRRCSDMNAVLKSTKCITKYCGRPFVRLRPNSILKCATNIDPKHKKLWGLINEISGKKNDKTGVLDYLTIDGVKDYNAKRICNRFAKYFASVGENFAAKSQLHPNQFMIT